MDLYLSTYAHKKIIHAPQEPFLYLPGYVLIVTHWVKQNGCEADAKMTE